MKRILSILLTLTMIIGLMSGLTLVASAAVDYTANGITGEGTEENPYIIDTAAKFTAIFGSGNSDATSYGEGIFYKITEDLTISNHKCNKLVFKGVLYADENKTLDFGTLPSNQLWLDSSLSSEWGFNTSYRCASAVLFTFADGATIKNITLNGAMANTNSHHQGAFAAFAKATTIENCVNNVDMTGVSPGENGGVGGFIGAVKESSPATAIKNCINNGDITGKTAVGGFIGDSYAGNLSNCENTGNIISNIAWGAAGGFIGYQRTGVTLSKCTNSGKVTAGANVANYSSGGMIGMVSSNVYGTRKAAVTECVNLGEIESLNATIYPGAIIGFSQGNIEIKNSMNIGSVTGGAGQGRAIGNLKKASGKTITIENYYDIGVVASRNAIATEYSNLTITITNTYGLSETPDEALAANELTNVSAATLRGLVSEGTFSSKVWENKVNNAYAYPTLISNPYFIAGPDSLGSTTTVFTSDSGYPMEVGGVSYDNYALIAAKAPELTGFTVKEFGIVLGESENITLENCKGVFTADADKIIQPSGAFGCLLYNTADMTNGFKKGRDYYVRPYAVYESSYGAELKVYGDAKAFAFADNN